MAFKMKGFSGFGNSPMKNEDIGATRPMTEDERKRSKANMGTAPGGIGAVVKGIKRLAKDHTKLHEDYETVAEATKSINPYSMGSMK